MRCAGVQAEITKRVMQARTLLVAAISCVYLEAQGREEACQLQMTTPSARACPAQACTRTDEQQCRFVTARVA